jgi:hypothetical protein
MVGKGEYWYPSADAKGRFGYVGADTTDMIAEKTLNQNFDFDKQDNF